jgi:hypothetical protein
MICQLHAPAASSPEKEAPGIHWIGGWVGPRSGLDTVKNKISSPAWIRTLPTQPIARRYTDFSKYDRTKRKIFVCNYSIFGSSYSEL